MVATACPLWISGVRALRVRRCGRCRHEYGDDAWHRLEIIQCILAAQVRGLVTSWPEDVAIEIRRCGDCGAPMARKEPTLGGPGRSR
jgi:hypothetical protein